MSFHSPNATAPSTIPTASTETDSASAPLLWNVDPLGSVGPPCVVLENGAMTVAEARELETAAEEVAFTIADVLTVSVVADTLAIAEEACMYIHVSMPSPFHGRIACREERRRTELGCAEPDAEPDREPLVADAPAGKRQGEPWNFSPVIQLEVVHRRKVKRLATARGQRRLGWIRDP